MNDFLKVIGMSLMGASLASLVWVGFERVNSNSNSSSNISSSTPTPSFSTSPEILSPSSSSSNNQSCTLDTNFRSIEAGKSLYGQLSRDSKCGDQARSVCGKLQIVWNSQVLADYHEAKMLHGNRNSLCRSGAAFGSSREKAEKECEEKDKEEIKEIEQKRKGTEQEIKNFCQKY